MDIYLVYYSIARKLHNTFQDLLERGHTEYVN